LNKIGKPALYLPAVMCVWGVISTCTAAVQSFGGLVAVRFVLGFVEAAYFVSHEFLLHNIDLETDDFVAWLLVLPFVLVHSQRACFPFCSSILWLIDLWSLLRPDRCRNLGRARRSLGLVSMALAL